MKHLFANWKMNMDRRRAESNFAAMTINRNVVIGVAPSFTLLPGLRDHADRLGIRLGGQNMHESKSGAFTGEISASQLLDVGADFVILGHSERRHIFNETNDRIEKKIEMAVVEGLPFVLCVGETKEQNDEGAGEEVVANQLRSALTALTDANLKDSMIAYEPVWAIGTGRVAADYMIESKHAMIREVLEELFGKEGKKMPILYGGSVAPENLENILSIPNVSGTLVGGASLDPQVFNEMIEITGDCK